MLTIEPNIEYLNNKIKSEEAAGNYAAAKDYQDMLALYEKRLAAIKPKEVPND